ncbi:MAG: hypothetical protein KDH97_03165 [Calditrichaeota bacterium]|nr:hypothetical protein [Calditrichota bacterium]MCB0294619.1 hypothetical protein [Calditrichota bacterium]MCB0302172.1 hypothetical protein [Calditrichota bacterium]
MMELPQSAITELQQIYREEYGIELSIDATKAEARRLLIFFHKLLLFTQEHGYNSPDELDGVAKDLQ